MAAEIIDGECSENIHIFVTALGTLIRFLRCPTLWWSPPRNLSRLSLGVAGFRPIALGIIHLQSHGLTIDGSLELAQMAIARLYDTTHGSVTVPRMLEQAHQEAAGFQHANERAVKAQVTKCNAAIAALDPVLESIRHRRNEWLAHLDPRTIANPKALSAKAQLSIPDLERAFHDTEKIVLDMALLYEGVFGHLRFIGDDDYEVALNWIRSAKCTFIENYEKEFGPWTDASTRPKDCSNNLLRMT